MMSVSSEDRGVLGKSCVLPAMCSQANLTKLFRIEETGRECQKLFQCEEGPTDNDEVVVSDDSDAGEEDGDEAAVSHVDTGDSGNAAVSHGNRCETGDSGNADDAETGRPRGDRGPNDEGEELEEERGGPAVPRLLCTGGTSSRVVTEAYKRREKRIATKNRNKAEKSRSGTTPPPESGGSNVRFELASRVEPDIGFDDENEQKEELGEVSAFVHLYT